MSFWIRDASVIIEKKKYYLDGMNFSFEVPFEDSDEPPVATIKIMNLSQTTRSAIKKNQKIILNAGYENDVGCILVGKVVGLKHNQSNTDWTTTITVMPESDKILKAKVNKTYAKKTKASFIIKDLLNILGVEVVRCQLTKDKVYSRGKVCKGKLKKVLSSIVKECKSKLVIRPTGQVYVLKNKSAIKLGVTLSSDNGLLRADGDQVAITYGSDDDGTSSTITRSCLLHYEIAPSVQVKIKSESLNGKFTVVKGKHTGNSTGDWKTEMELKKKK